MTSKVQAITGKRLPPNAGKGRPRGSRNKATASVKAAPIVVTRKRELHGGKRHGAGRPAKSEKTVVVAIRMTERQREHFTRLGGAAWLRGLLGQES